MSKKSDRYPLSDLKVLDFSRVLAGPFAGRMLSDLGADVIKIEPPEVGDSLRWLIPRAGLPEGVENYCWQLTGRNKRSISINFAVCCIRE